jgi:hypothetical protein
LIVAKPNAALSASHAPSIRRVLTLSAEFWRRVAFYCMAAILFACINRDQNFNAPVFLAERFLQGQPSFEKRFTFWFPLAFSRASRWKDRAPAVIIYLLVALAVAINVIALVQQRYGMIFEGL